MFGKVVYSTKNDSLQIMFSGKAATIYFLIFIFSPCCVGCRSTRGVNSHLNKEMPARILWAWERAEDLRFIDTEKYGVAFLAQTLFLQNDSVVVHPRRQPLQISPKTYLIAVTRIETEKQSDGRPRLSEEQKEKIVSLVEKTLALPGVKAIQIDFDATVSERSFYQNLLVDLRKRLPAKTPLTITALASWCVGDAWFGDLPVDEAVPMAFRMGADDRTVREFLAKGNDWSEPLCRGSYGIALDERFPAALKPDRRFYIFNSAPRGWRAEDLQQLSEGVWR